MAEPEFARPDPRALPLLSKLSHSLRAIAIVSGRDTEFLARQLPIVGLLLLGNHGLEERRQGRSEVVAEAIAYLPSLRRAADELAVAARTHSPGIRIEPKRVGVSVHFRRADDPTQASASLLPVVQAIAAREHLTVQPGRLVYELRPPIAIDKGEVVRGLFDRYQPTAVVYAGDDRTDGHAFRALKAMAGASLRTLAVGVRSHEVPADSFIDCDVVVDGVEGTIELLQDLVELNRAA